MFFFFSSFAIVFWIICVLKLKWSKGLCHTDRCFCNSYFNICLTSFPIHSKKHWCELDNHGTTSLVNFSPEPGQQWWVPYLSRDYQNYQTDWFLSKNYIYIRKQTNKISQACFGYSVRDFFEIALLCNSIR